MHCTSFVQQCSGSLIAAVSSCVYEECYLWLLAAWGFTCYRVFLSAEISRDCRREWECYRNWCGRCNPLDILDYSHPAVDRTLMRVVAHHCGTAMDIERGAIMDLNLHFTYPSMTWLEIYSFISKFYSTPKRMIFANLPKVLGWGAGTILSLLYFVI